MTTECADGSVVAARLVELSDRLTRADSRIRRHEARGVHQMRVTLRRLRSILKTFGPLFDNNAVVSLRGELVWLAGELGAARDHEVVRDRLRVLAVAPDERALIEVESRDAETAGVTRSLAALDSVRYTRLRHDLTAFAAAPPWAVDPPPPDDALRAYVRRDWKRLARRVRATTDVADDADRHAELHRVRKSAKRLRYSSETLVPTYGADARRLARGAKRLQTELGDVQDSLVAQAWLRELAAAGDRPDDEIFILGGLSAQERLLAAQAEARWTTAWAKLDRKRNRRWLR